MGYFDSIYVSDLPHRARTVYMYLKDRINKDGTCWPSIRTIAQDLHLSRATVQRALNDLCAAGYLSTRSQILGLSPDRVQPSFTLSHRSRQARPPAASRARAAQTPRRHASSAAEAAEAATQQAITAPRSGWGPKA